MYDALLILQAATTATAATTSTAVDLGGGTPRRGLKARVVVTTLSGASTTAAFKIQHSTDNTTFYDLAEQLGGAAMTAAGVDFIPFETSSRYVRLVMTTAGTAPNVVYHSEIGNARPS